MLVDPPPSAHRHDALRRGDCGAQRRPEPLRVALTRRVLREDEKVKPAVAAVRKRPLSRGSCDCAPAASTPRIVGAPNAAPEKVLFVCVPRQFVNHGGGCLEERRRVDVRHKHRRSPDASLPVRLLAAAALEYPFCVGVAGVCRRRLDDFFDDLRRSLAS